MSLPEKLYTAEQTRQLDSTAIEYYQIPGMTPSLLNLPEGCAFRERCPRADNACLVTPEITSPLPGRQIRCFHPLLNEAS